jgi:hypothetical protein
MDRSLGSKFQVMAPWRWACKTVNRKTSLPLFQVDDKGMTRVFSWIYFSIT